MVAKEFLYDFLKSFQIFFTVGYFNLKYLQNIRVYVYYEYNIMYIMNNNTIISKIWKLV